MKNKSVIKKPNIPLKRKLAILYARIALTLKFLVLLVASLMFFTNYLDFVKQEIAQNSYEIAADIGFRFKEVLIEGQQNMPEEEILTTLNADTGTPIFAINLQDVQTNLIKNNWIKVAVVERRLPSTIYIAILERVPIAIWQINQKLFLIDEEGYKITLLNPDQKNNKFGNLLHVVGTDANIYANKLIHDLKKYPELYSNVISAVRYGERRWNLNLQQNITVKMPEYDFDKALNYLLQLNKNHKLFDQNYKTLDLRDNNKYYIEYIR